MIAGQLLVTLSVEQDLLGSDVHSAVNVSISSLGPAAKGFVQQ